MRNPSTVNKRRADFDPSKSCEDAATDPRGASGRAGKRQRGGFKGPLEPLVAGIYRRLTRAAGLGSQLPQNFFRTERFFRLECCGICFQTEDTL